MDGWSMHLSIYVNVQMYGLLLVVVVITLLMVLLAALV